MSLERLFVLTTSCQLNRVDLSPCQWSHTRNMNVICYVWSGRLNGISKIIMYVFSVSEMCMHLFGEKQCWYVIDTLLLFRSETCCGCDTCFLRIYIVMHWPKYKNMIILLYHNIIILLLYIIIVLYYYMKKRMLKTKHLSKKYHLYIFLQIS